MNSNTNYLGNLVGATNISSIGNGTVTGAISKLNSRVSHMGHYCTIPIKETNIPASGGTSYVTIQPTSAGSTAFFQWFATGGINLNYQGYYLVTVYLALSNTTSTYNSITSFLQYHDNTTETYTSQNNGYFCGGITCCGSTSSSARGAGSLTRMVYASTDNYRLLLQSRNNHAAESGDTNKTKHRITVEDSSYIQIMYLGHENL